ncbi:PREDICTED: uncharacterized protein LOC105561385 [Vollenhovia emeryi]|uniref:uncharacterized protein LOC105561385 n=1 Tax=Vollenhovia emeryi TaxID=411798 RepID=UPI0005F4DBF3|nr:PREDICTED: uncharacterized protein LOC105561385 [Vollenhovia emeryi]
MERQRLENLSLEELQSEARRLGLKPPDTQPWCIDALMSFYERNSLPREKSASVLPPGSSSDTSSLAAMNPGTNTASSEAVPPLFCSLLLDQMRQQQEVMKKVLDALTLSQSNQDAHSSAGMANSPGNRSDVSHESKVQRNPALASVSPAQAVKLLQSQISEFDGSEDGNVDLWLQKVEQVSQIHGVSQKITFLAATAKLTKSARRWYELCNGSAIESWTGFKEAVSKRFKRRILFDVATQKVEARTWMYSKESFQEYALDKLALMKNVCLPEQESIHLLINGIGSNALRSIATSLRVDTVDEFLEAMHPITIFFGEKCKKGFTGSPKFDRKKASGSFSNKMEQQQSKSRGKGHVRADCAKLKKKEQQPHQVKDSSFQASVSAVVETESGDETVAVINQDDERTKSKFHLSRAITDLLVKENEGKHISDKSLFAART